MELGKLVIHCLDSVDRRRWTNLATSVLIYVSLLFSKKKQWLAYNNLFSLNVYTTRKPATVGDLEQLKLCKKKKSCIRVPPSTALLHKYFCRNTFESFCHQAEKTDGEGGRRKKEKGGMFGIGTESNACPSSRHSSSPTWLPLAYNSHLEHLL